MTTKKIERRIKIKYRIRKNVFGTAERPRMSVFRSNKQIYVQVINDLEGKTLASASSLGLEAMPKIEQAEKVVTKKAQAKYGFIVKPEANKVEIAKEIEALYNVTVEDVNTLRYAGKRSSRYTKAGLVRGQKNAFKKAIVTLKEGDTIDFYSNIQ